MKRLTGALVVCAMMTSAALAEPIQPEKRSESLEKDALALVLIGGVTLAASAGLAYAAKQRSDEISNQIPSAPWPENVYAVEREGQRLSNLSMVTGVVGGAFLVTSALCYWRSRVAERDEREHVIVSPIATPSSAGLALTGAF